AGWVVLIVNDPNTALNPFPPPTIAPALQLPTLTPSPTVTSTPTLTLTPTVTPTNTATTTPTPTATATYTPLPTITPTGVLAGVSDPASPVPPAPPAEPTLTPAVPLDDGSGGAISGDPAGAATPYQVPTRSPFPFTASVVQYQPHAGDEGCQWLSIAGRVIGLDGVPLPGLTIEINGDNFRNIQFSGSATQWGAGGFEFNLGAAPRTATYTLRVSEPTGGPVSELIYVDTGNTCQSNVAVVEFIQNHPY
ncbi:MAG: hypothetical protein JXQ72_16795, partial [Anaerolineae bacterium]|nr:hypothetical protein [Anaerolineae bacterium]